MQIASVNFNRRLGNPRTRSRVEAWLRVRRPKLLFGQEPFHLKLENWPVLDGYTLVSRTPLLACWIAAQHSRPMTVERTERWHEIVLGRLTIHNVYLSPYSSKERCDMLNALAGAISFQRGESSIVVGDFNLAPRPADGLFGSQHSTFTSPAERAALTRLRIPAKPIMIPGRCRSAFRDDGDHHRSEATLA